MAMHYKVVEGWEQLPRGFAHRDVAGVAVDQEDRVFLICRGENPVIVYDREGNFLRTWGKGDFSMRTHGIYVAPNGSIFATDDGNHTVRQFTPEGRLLMTMGTLNVPADTGYDARLRARLGTLGLPSTARPTSPSAPRATSTFPTATAMPACICFPLADSCSARGESPAMVPASSGCRMASPSPPTVGYSCATAKSTGFRFSVRR
jgi:hypothetical protein